MFPVLILARWQARWCNIEISEGLAMWNATSVSWCKCDVFILRISAYYNVVVTTAVAAAKMIDRDVILHRNIHRRPALLYSVLYYTMLLSVLCDISQPSKRVCLSSDLENESEAHFCRDWTTVQLNLRLFHSDVQVGQKSKPDLFYRPILLWCS